MPPRQPPLHHPKGLSPRRWLVGYVFKGTCGTGAVSAVAKVKRGGRRQGRPQGRASAPHRASVQDGGGDTHGVYWGGLEPDRPDMIKVGEKVGTNGIYMGERGKYDVRNTLNDLTGKEWLLFTKSWFTHNPTQRSKTESLHPAKYPESMITEFLKFFTKKNDLVLDPMVGTGSTLVACDQTHRRGIGIELTKKWATIAKNRTSQRVIRDDARNLKKILQKNNIKSVDYCITSPPYWNMLRNSRGGVESAAKIRKKNGLVEHYSEDEKDLGNIKNYEEYLEVLVNVYEQVYDVMGDNKYFTVICQNVLTAGGTMMPLAWDIASRLRGTFKLKQEKIWLQENKMLGTWGYPFRYVSNVHHHYCLIFEKVP